MPEAGTSQSECRWVKEAAGHYRLVDASGAVLACVVRKPTDIETLRGGQYWHLTVPGSPDSPGDRAPFETLRAAKASAERLVGV